MELTKNESSAYHPNEQLSNPENLTNSIPADNIYIFFDNYTLSKMGQEELIPPNSYAFYDITLMLCIAVGFLAVLFLMFVILYKFNNFSTFLFGIWRSFRNRPSKTFQATAKYVENSRKSSEASINDSDVRFLDFEKFPSSP